MTTSPSTVNCTLPVDNELVHFYQGELTSPLFMCVNLYSFSVACDGQHLYLHPVNVKCLIKVTPCLIM